MTTQSLSPYDTGERCEPKSWIPYGTKVTEATPAENFGKVDFEDDEAHTVAIVHIERRRDGTHVVHVQPLVDEDEVQVELHLEDGVQTLYPRELG